MKPVLIRLVLAFGLLSVSGCASTSSVLIPASVGAPSVALILDGPLGDQAADLISQELAVNGIGVVERARTRQVIGVDTDLSSASPDSVQALSTYGQELGVQYFFSGTVSAESGPLYSFSHVNMTLRLIDVRTGQTRWIGRYGNSMWTDAISQQGDLQRGAKHIVREFIRAGGPAVLQE